MALVGTRSLRPVVADEQLEVLRMLVDRRRALGEEHTRKVSQLHALLLELIPGGANKDLSAAQAKRLLGECGRATYGWESRWSAVAVVLLVEPGAGAIEPMLRPC